MNANTHHEAPQAAERSGSEGDVIVDVRDVARIYRLRGGDVHALRGVTLTIRKGEYVSIMGPSGSGKTTLFNIIGGLDRPTHGVVSVGGVALQNLDSRTLAWHRCRRIGYIFQTFNLIPTLTALENAMLPCRFRMLDKAEASARAAEALSAVGLGDRMDHRPHELSGGQMQRVAIARSLVNQPDIILADEPTGNLDLNTGESIINLLRQMNLDRGVTVITVTHDHKMLAVSDRIVWFSEGSVERIQNRADMDINIGVIS